MNLIVAFSKNMGIGYKNKIPWYLKNDLKYFKQLTIGNNNNAVVMGRKTYESIGRPLPNRINLIVSNTIKEIIGAELFKSTEDAINKAKELCINKNLDEIIIIGGGYLFRDTLSITNKLVLTKVDCNIEGDVFYPDIDLNEWEKLSSEHFTKDSDNDYDFTVITYEKSM